MASGIFAIMDDIAALMDDVAVASKVATQKTMGILGDDLAVNAEKATGFVSSRELPVLWAIIKGSFLNKLIIVPIALLLNAYFPIAIKYILIAGGIYLAYEGVEKIIHYLFHRNEEDDKEEEHGEEAINESPEEIEHKKIRAAIVTDFILSIEIVIIALNTVLERDLTIQILTVSIVAILATVGVYGIVALIVRIDDMGYKMMNYADMNSFKYRLGNILVKSLPVIIKILSIVGTIALILVGGGILVHKLAFFHHFLPALPAILRSAIVGIIGGLVAIPIFWILGKIVSLVKGTKA